MYLILYIIDLLIVAFWISDAVYAFSRKRYFCFGLDAMLAITTAASAIKLLLTH